MASSSAARPPNSPTVADAPVVAVDAKLMVATGHDDCQQLKNLVNKQDATTMVVVMASGNQASAAELPLAIIHPLLLSSACRGYWEELNFLLNKEDTEAEQSMISNHAFLDVLSLYNSSNGRLAMQRASDDVEKNAGLLAQSAASLLQGVTVEGDTALHMVAVNGDDDDFTRCASVIYGKAEHLLFKQNKKGDTPLHCAARAGKSLMVSHLISLATGQDSNVNRVTELLETENNLKETALHEAVRIGNNDIVKLLMEKDSELASFPKDGSSPLYLAILLEKEIIAEKLYSMSHGKLSYSGPNGQNALHAAVLRGTVLTKKLLGWNKDLTTQVDKNGSTPLHFAAALQRQHRRGSVCCQVLEANPAALYQSDHQGLFPIHVAASVGAKGTVAMFLKKSPSCAGLRDAKGRTFLHVAVGNKTSIIVSFVCRNPSLAWILNIQDNDGNAALHLAVQSGKLRMFGALFGNRQVHLNLTNDERQTPLDIARYKIPQEMYYTQNSEATIYRALELAGARNGDCRQDHFEQNYSQQVKHDERRESEKVKDSTQTLCIGSVLIATVTFGATFGLPGGYRADDHPNGGSPTLAGRWIFDAFMMANTLAFICSSIATLGLMYSGTSMVNLRSRKVYFNISVYFMSTSVTSLTAAFTLGVYTVLSPVAHKTAVAICVMSPLVVVGRKMEFCLKWALLAPSLCVRKGRVWTLAKYARLTVDIMLFEFWPLIFIFSWAANARYHPVSKTEPPIQPPAPLA